MGSRGNPDRQGRGACIGRWFAWPLVVAAAASALAGCATEHEAARRFAVASWNLEWLADLRSPGFWETCRGPSGEADVDPLAGRLPPCAAYRRIGVADAGDYVRRKLGPVREGLAQLAARKVDVLAVQEVQGVAVLDLVRPQGYRVACVTTRDESQNLAFLVREDSMFTLHCREIEDLSLEAAPSGGRPVRRGLELVLGAASAELAILNVHLKAGCARGRMDEGGNAACRTLQQQAAPLERWIAAQAALGRAWMVIGDWNRDLEEEVRGGFPARSDGSDPAGPIDPPKIRNLLAEIADGQSGAPGLSLVSVDRAAAANGICHAHLDHLVVGASPVRSAGSPFDLGDAPSARLTPGPAGASDHCMLEAAWPRE